jgi:tRNA(adenine34) deaminase
MTLAHSLCHSIECAILRENFMMTEREIALGAVRPAPIRYNRHSPTVRVAVPSTPTVGSDVDFMHRAMELARRAESANEVPVGALVVQNGEVLGEGWNRPIATQDPTAHAEIVALRAAASRRQNYRLEQATLYVTLEPCPMCIGAALNARIMRVVFGASDLKAGACGGLIDVPRTPRISHRIDVFGGVCSEECALLLRRFFEVRRSWKCGPP